MIDGGRAVGKAGLDAVPTVANRVIRAPRNHRGDLTPLVAPHLNRLQDARVLLICPLLARHVVVRQGANEPCYVFASTRHGCIVARD
eukprot:CAMPEP_0181256560 /NCGR_PEP_ID=MMETSP1096-20121128/49780_1 /TAXON_ID=156174 ORGANISM="Chrysochromulina ericina, Strain CCMP281" /NCGR_SAMPLE_ID=MMETSP1096 /ASSEMBLY_ACC=CAM_ASM_000453 /LENGTH=86 /DNA_ID=CAMNT_0023354827 /DNA_START=79 /DNA_END=336 /DNA_ORIENTATION=-